ncbi:unnamed protein product [Caenorhabditis bovis]|uniref:ShKT domain-containing protein n=1 Tax=Caenorhabditis bovis TaxID=2654633 RepID=A0A8S1ESF9_9PELO|nr:unnamed protein product [Caenorhabditis bovis]
MQQFIVFSSLVILAISQETFKCQNGEVSKIPCKSGFLGRKSCEDTTKTCEGGKFCCSAPLKTTKPPRGASKTTSAATSSPACDGCDVVTRHRCFLSMHSYETNTTISPSSECLKCQNCCADAFPDRCAVWKNKKFCELEWYSNDKRKILCGKTCGLC